MLLMAGCFSNCCAGAVGMRASGGWGSFDPSTAASGLARAGLLRAAIKRRGVVLLGSLVYALL